MRSKLVTVVIFLLVMAMVISACCLSWKESDNISAAHQVNTSSTVIVESTTSLMNYSINSSTTTSLWVTINPVAGYQPGDVFEINGTTNLGPSEKLHYSIDRLTYIMPIACPTGYGSCSPMVREGSKNITYGEIRVKNGNFSRNFWSFSLNTSGPEFATDSWVGFSINVTSSDNFVFNSTQFVLQHEYMRT